MSETYTFKRGDNAVGMQSVLLKPNGSPEDLTNAEVKFIMRRGSSVPRIDRLIDIVDEEGGEVRVVFTAAELAVVGLHKAEYEATYPDGRVQSYPSNDYIVIHIIEDLS